MPFLMVWLVSPKKRDLKPLFFITIVIDSVPHWVSKLAQVVLVNYLLFDNW